MTLYAVRCEANEQKTTTKHQLLLRDSRSQVLHGTEKQNSKEEGHNGLHLH